MLTFETVNELMLKVTCSGRDVLYTKAGSFIAGENAGAKNYRFDKVLFGPQNNLGQAVLGSLVRRVTGENIPLMKVELNGDSVTYYANYGQHVVIYHLSAGRRSPWNPRISSLSHRTAITASASSAWASSPRRAWPPRR